MFPYRQSIGFLMAWSRNVTGKGFRRYVTAAVGAGLLLAAVGLPFSVGYAQVTTSGLKT